jgi:hypothetical protein
MVLLLPASNDSLNACQGLEAREAARPPMSMTLYDALTGLNIAYCVLFTLSIPVLYVYKDEPRFARIRPFHLSTAMMIVAVVYTQGCLLPPQLRGFPCALELFLQMLGYAVATSIFCARVLVFVVETQYSIAVSKEGGVVRDHSSSASSVPSTNHDGFPEVNFVLLLKDVVSVGTGFKKIDAVSLQVLSNLRRRYLSVFLCISLPPFFVYAISVLSVSVYRSGCTDCGITIEFFVSALAYPTFCVPFMLRYVYIALSYKQDQQNVMREIMLTAASAPPWSYVGYALEIADPNQVVFNREFTFLILPATGSLFFWFQVVFVQVLRAYQFRREQNRRARSLQPTDQRKTFLEECAADQTIKREFYTYVASRYAIELLKFVDDVKAYKHHFDGHNEMWRRKKAHEIINTYVRNDAPQEVNISETQRDRILHSDLDKAPQKLFTMFDEALNEVVTVMNTGMWIEFKNSKPRAKSMKLAAVASDSAA